MSKRSVQLTHFIGVAAILSAFAVGPIRARNGSALTGQVSSAEEGPMEGVVVSAKREGSIVTTSVVSDAKGQYSFPQSRLEPGRYTIRIRAVGYDLDTTGPMEIESRQTKRLDLKLAKAQDLAAQLSNAEWLLSIPGTDEQKARIAGCTSCHTLERVVRTRYSAAQWPAILQRMSNYAPGAIPLHPQVRAGVERDDGMVVSPATRPQAEYLSTINLSAGRWAYSSSISCRLPRTYAGWMWIIPRRRSRSGSGTTTRHPLSR